jgi:hypothetical protein
MERPRCLWLLAILDQFHSREWCAIFGGPLSILRSVDNAVPSGLIAVTDANGNCAASSR